MTDLGQHAPIAELLRILYEAYKKAEDKIAFGQSDVVQTWVEALYILSTLQDKPMTVEGASLVDKREMSLVTDLPPPSSRTDYDTFVYMNKGKLWIVWPGYSLFLTLE